MDLCVLLLICTGIPPLILSIGHKYYLIQQGLSWNDAQAYCRAKYTDLATIITNDDLVKIQNAAAIKGFSSGAWIGLYTDTRKWQWSLGNEPLGSFTNWITGTPTNMKGVERCTYIYKGKWYDETCNLIIRSVCYDGRVNATNRYIFVTQRMKWTDAQSYCRHMYTDLVSVRDATENLVVGGKDYWNWIWFGLYKDPWKWSDQTSNESVLTWWGGDANDYVQNKSCGLLYGGKADQAQCSDVMPFFCYGFPNQLIIRMKVKSSVDANDPVIGETILEKVNQTLMAGGITQNISVKWRRQLDGVVFHKEKEKITTTDICYP